MYRIYDDGQLMAEALQLDQLMEGLDNLCEIQQHILKHGISAPLRDLVGAQLEAFVPAVKEQDPNTADAEVTEVNDDQKKGMLKRIWEAIKKIYRAISDFLKKVLSRIKSFIQSKIIDNMKEKARAVQEWMAKHDVRTVGWWKNQTVPAQLTGKEYIEYWNKLEESKKGADTLYDSARQYTSAEPTQIKQAFASGDAFVEQVDTIITGLEQYVTNWGAEFNKFDEKRKTDRTLHVKDFTDQSFFKFTMFDVQMAILQTVVKNCELMQNKFERNANLNYRDGEFDQQHVAGMRKLAKVSGMLTQVYSGLAGRTLRITTELSNILNYINKQIPRPNTVMA